MRNLSPQALRNIKSRDNTVIKKADKGGAVVVWNKELYLAEGERQLSEKVSHDCTREINRIVNDVIEEETAGGNLEKGARAPVVSSSRCGKFYLLPKIHKTGNPGRPTKCKNIFRLKRLCSEETDFVCQTEVMSTFFEDRGYPLSVISSAREKVSDINRDEMLNAIRPQSVVSKIPLVLMM